MRNISEIEINGKPLSEILHKHELWLQDQEGGERANLQSADLQSADLRDADLQSANLQGADLQGVDLRGADLRDADLRSADLRWARNVPNYVCTMTNICPSGDFFSWKKAFCGTSEEMIVIVKLLVPESAKRSNATGIKCRFEFAKVLEYQTLEGDVLPPETKVHSIYDFEFIYPKPGEIVYPDRWDDDRWYECSHGIHGFLTREEAVEYEIFRRMNGKQRFSNS